MARSILLPVVISSIAPVVLCNRVEVVNEIYGRHVNHAKFPLMPRYTNATTTGGSATNFGTGQVPGGSTTVTTPSAPSSPSTTTTTIIPTTTTGVGAGPAPVTSITTFTPPPSVSLSTVSDVTTNTHTTINGTPVPVLHGCSFCPLGPAGIILGGIPDVPGVYPPPSDAPSGFPTITIGDDLNPTVGPEGQRPDGSDLTTLPPPTSVSTSIISDVTTNTHTTINGVPVPVLHGCAFCPAGPLGLILGGIPDVPGIYPPPLTAPFPGFPTVTIGDDLNPTVDTNNDITTDPSNTETTQTTTEPTSTPTTSSVTVTSTITTLDWTQWQSTDESGDEDDAAASMADSLINELWGTLGAMPPAGTDNPPAATPSVSVQIWRINEELTNDQSSLKTSQTVAIEVPVDYYFPEPVCQNNDLTVGSPVFLWYQFEPYESPSVSIPSKFDLKNLTASGCTFSGTFGQTGTLACDNNFNIDCHMYAGQTGFACDPSVSSLVGCTATSGDCNPSYWKVADCNF